MAWTADRATTRIKKFMLTVPQLDGHITLAKQRSMLVEARAKNMLDELSARRAFVVPGAHVYGQLLNFNDIVADEYGVEIEQSQRRALAFLNAQYQLWDSISEDEGVNRVDFHGARMHAIATEPEAPREQIKKAVALAVRLEEATKRIAGAFGVVARIRFGIDQGRCVAMTTGRAMETDALFLGAPANHAAKLAAADDGEGIFLTPNAEAIVGVDSVFRDPRGRIAINARFLAEAVQVNPFSGLDQAANQIIAELRLGPEFRFFRPTPPLSDLKFKDLTPSHSARADMASLFADIDKYTPFVDAAVRAGSEAIKKAVMGIHVIREELNSVLQEDFGGKRIRFIGDCIQGVISKRIRIESPSESVSEAGLCASAMRNSLELCQKIVGGLDSLGLAIGIEYGPIPVTRIGHRGDESVRCAASRTVVIAERVQQEIDGSGVRLGPVASALANTTVKKLYASSARIPSYDAAVDMLGSVASPAVARVREDPSARPYFHPR